VQEAKTCVKYIKDLGGGGLATAAAELAEWFNLGLELNLDAIHKADIDIGPVEVLTGETQERLVFITDNLQCLQELFEKYDVPYSILGRFTEGKKLVFRWKGSVVVDIPISLAAEAPEVEWPEGGYHPPEVPQLSIPPIEKAVDRVLSSPNVAKKEAIYQRFDFDVGVRTVLKPGEGDAAALKLYEYNNLGIVVKGDANPRYTYLSPRLGAANVFVKTYRNVVAAGGRPLAAVDSINLGSPARAEVYWQFKEVVRGLAEAAAALDVPIVGGKVSLYNEKERPIKPVVVVVVLGKADMSSLKRAMWRDRDKVFIHGVTRGEIGGSEYLYRVFGLVAGRPPAVDYRSERELAELMARFHITGATDVGLGGLAVAFAKLAVNSGVGAEIDICKAPAEVTRVDYLLFSESNGRLVTTGESGPGVEVGSVGGEELVYRCGSTVLYKRGVKELEELMTLRF
ncbi:MAG: AIR synthase-related protein, partial [Pyrobaculum sp.]